MSLNIAHGRGTSAHQLLLSRTAVQKNLDRIAELLISENPAFVGLQEVDQLSRWNGSFDHIRYLAKRAQYRSSAFGPHMTRLRLRYGAALLSRSMLHTATSGTFYNGLRPLPPKGFLSAETTLGSSRPFQIVSVHLDFLQRRIRSHQIQTLIQYLSQHSLPTIILGDFNCEWHSPDSAIQTLCQELSLSTFEPESTQLATFPLRTKRWDWIFVSDHFEFLDYRSLEGAFSDHLPVIATLKLRQEKT